MNDLGNVNCIPNPYPVVYITNNASPWHIGRRTDLYIYGSYEYIGEIESIQWSLIGGSAVHSTQFFALSASNYTTLIIPFTQLQSNGNARPAGHSIAFFRSAPETKFSPSSYNEKRTQSELAREFDLIGGGGETEYPDYCHFFIACACTG